MKKEELFEIVRDRDLIKVDGIELIKELFLPEKPNMFHIVIFDDGSAWVYIDTLVFHLSDEIDIFLEQIDYDTAIIAEVNKYLDYNLTG